MLHIRVGGSKSNWRWAARTGRSPAPSLEWRWCTVKDIFSPPFLIFTVKELFTVIILDRWMIFPAMSDVKTRKIKVKQVTMKMHLLRHNRTNTSLWNAEQHLSTTTCFNWTDCASYFKQATGHKQSSYSLVKSFLALQLVKSPQSSSKSQTILKKKPLNL